MKTSSTPHPERTECQDVMELSGGRIWMLCFEVPDCLQKIPRLFLEQYPNEDALDDLQDDGRVWFRPEDMPMIIEMFASLLDACRACARERTEFQDVMELSSGRICMLCFEDPGSPEKSRTLFVEQFHDEASFEDMLADGRLWCLPQDLPLIIEKLSFWLDAYRACAREDASGPAPHPNWGALQPAVADE